MDTEKVMHREGEGQEKDAKGESYRQGDKEEQRYRPAMQEERNRELEREGDHSSKPQFSLFPPLSLSL